METTTWSQHSWANAIDYSTNSSVSFSSPAHYDHVHTSSFMKPRKCRFCHSDEGKFCTNEACMTLNAMDVDSWRPWDSIGEAV